MTKKTIFKQIIFILILSFILSGCSLNTKKPFKTKQNQKDKKIDKIISKNLKQQLDAQKDIKKFTSIDELKEFLENNKITFVSGRGMDMGRGMVMEKGLAIDGMSAPQAIMKSENIFSETEEISDVRSDDYSKTNVQVQGVDEADIIKTDGKYIYAVVKNDLYIINAYPADNMEILSKINFKSRPQDIYINDNNLVIFGQNKQIYKTEVYKKFRRRGQYTFFKVFDITDKKNPKQTRDLNFEGSYNDSRMIGDYVYFVIANRNYNYIDNEPVLPRILDGNKIVKNIKPDIYYFNMPYSSYNFTSISAINIKDNNKKINSDIYLMSNTQNMYVSQNNIYITYTKYISEYQLEMEVMKEIIYPLLSKKDQDKISKIESVENFILNQNEKTNKIMMIIENFGASLSEEEQEKLAKDTENKMKQKYEDISKELEKTVIHKIAINKGDLEYKTNGEVTGKVLNQFSMDENNGFFRIATTKNRTWSRYNRENRKSYNNLYVLDENLKQVGALENLAEDEKIYSVRFMQNRAYMVTFKQIDPLFVIDLSNPKNPTVLGKLKIPGYSDYLHPYDETTLIGLGKDTGESELGGLSVKGLKLSLFDVADVKNPKEIDTYIMGDSGSDSIALRDHKAFLFSKEKNLLSIPVSIREQAGEKNWQRKLVFSGVAVFNIDKKGFKLKGKIDHSDGGISSPSDYWHGYSYYDNTVKRSLYIDDNLYTFSNKYIKVNNINDLEIINKIELKKNKKQADDDFEIIN